MAESGDDVKFDWQRARRTGIPEVILADSKSVQQLANIINSCLANGHRALFTRMQADKAQLLVEQFGVQIGYHALSRTMQVPPVGTHKDAVVSASSPVGIVAAGTSDLPVVAEIEQTLNYLGQRSTPYMDRGVAGLWRLLDDVDALSEHAVIIAVAGMEGALFSVLAGLVTAPVIAVPTSVGYGVSAGGHAALNSALGSCSPGIAVVNIDNGFGAAALAVKMLTIRS